MRYSLLAGGKRIRPVLALATARALGRDPRWRAAARRRARADPHLLADPRRPAGDGRRRPAPRPADVSRPLRRGRRDPGRRRALRGGVPARAARAARRAGATCSRRSPSSRPRPASTGWSAGQYIDVRAIADGSERSLRRLHELKTGRLIGASVECVLLLNGARDPSPTLSDFRAFAAELGVLFQIVDDILDVTGTDAALGKPQGSDERHGKLTYVTRYGLDGARDAGRRVAPQRARGARPGGARRRRRARADHRLHRHPHLMTTPRPHRPPAGPPRPHRGRARSRSRRRSASC